RSGGRDRNRERGRVSIAHRDGGREALSARVTCRFAPSTTGPAHLGTLTAALLAWLDARSRGARVILRLEDLDPDRCKPQHMRSIESDLAWFGLDWDERIAQHTLFAQHEAAMDRLEKLGVLYPSSISREELRRIGRRAPDGAWAYD